MSNKKPRNRISAFRKKRKLTLKELADAVGLRVDHHALYESDCHPVPVYLAAEYAKALGVSVRQLFPGDASLLKKHEASPKFPEVGLTSSAIGAEIRSKGLDYSVQQFWVSCEMRHKNSIRWRVASDDVDRLLDWLDDVRDTICFDTPFTRVFLRKKHATKIFVGWEPIHHLPPPSDEFVFEHLPTHSSLSIWTADTRSVEKISFDYELDGEGENVSLGQIERFFWSTEIADDFDNDDCVSTCFVDSEGDYVWVNRVDIAAAETPLINVSRELYALYFSDEYEHEE